MLLDTTTQDSNRIRFYIYIYTNGAYKRKSDHILLSSRGIDAWSRDYIKPMLCFTWERRL